MASRFYIPPARNFKLVQRPPDFSIDKNHQLAKDLVFAGLGKFPGTNLYTDSSGYGNNGTLTGFTSAGNTPLDKWQFIPQLGRFGLSFDGDNDYAQGPNRPIIANLNNSSVCAWISTTYSGKNRYKCIYSEVNYSGNAYYSFHMEKYSSCLSMYHRDDAGTGTAITPGPTVLNTGAFFNVILTKKNKTIRLCVNGKEDRNQQVTGTDTLTSTSSRIGNDSNTYLDQSWTGIITDLLVFSRTLSDAEISLLANPTNVMLSGLVVPPRRKMWAVPQASAGSILKISGVTWANTNKVSGVAKSSIKKISGVSAV